MVEEVGGKNLFWSWMETLKMHRSEKKIHEKSLRRWLKLSLFGWLVAANDVSYIAERNSKISPHLIM